MRTYVFISALKMLLYNKTNPTNDSHYTLGVIGLEEVVKTFREMLREELAPIHRKLDEHGRMLEEHGRKLDEHGRKLDEHGRKLDEHDGQFAAIRQQLDRIEQSQTEDVIGLLKVVNVKYDRLEERSRSLESRLLAREASDAQRDQKIDLLNERMFRVETDVRLLRGKRDNAEI